MEGVNDAERRRQLSIESLAEDEQELLIVELIDYADHQIQTRAHWIWRGVPPRGYDAPALALEAISRLLDGRRRDWDPEKEPTVTAYLKSVVKSIFSSEILAAANQELAEVPATDESGRDRTANVASPSAGPEAAVELDELKEHILDSFELEEDQLVLMCVFDGIITPADIASETGLERRDVYRIKQKIRRRLVGFREDG